MKYDKIQVMRRWIVFFLMIAVGFAIGLYYAWVLNPVELIDTTPDTLRQDYRVDYVLMVAEVYQSQEDPEQAARSLGFLGDEGFLVVIQQAMLYAEEAGYSQADLSLFENLFFGLQSWNPQTGELSQP